MTTSNRSIIIALGIGLVAFGYAYQSGMLSDEAPLEEAGSVAAVDTDHTALAADLRTHAQTEEPAGLSEVASAEWRQQTSLLEAAASTMSEDTVQELRDYEPTTTEAKSRQEALTYSYRVRGFSGSF